MHQDPHPLCVFVYGTLRQGQANDITRLQPAPILLGTARVRGTLHHLGDYPGVVLGGTGLVHGEVYAIDPVLEARLDEIEMIYPQQRDEYFKRHIPLAVALASGGQATLQCICYEYNPVHLKGAPVIAGGDWVIGR
ncbi:MAG: gamma-glutamylcyclotransferase family protein [Ottowia sp.]